MQKYVSAIPARSYATSGCSGRLWRKRNMTGSAEARRWKRSCGKFGKRSWLVSMSEISCANRPKMQKRRQTKWKFASWSCGPDWTAHIGGQPCLRTAVALARTRNQDRFTTNRRRHYCRAGITAHLRAWTSTKQFGKLQNGWQRIFMDCTGASTKPRSPR